MARLEAQAAATVVQHKEPPTKEAIDPTFAALLNRPMRLVAKKRRKKPNKNAETIRVLKKGRRRLKWRWCQEEFIAKNGACCLLGAVVVGEDKLKRFNDDNDSYHPEETAAGKALARAAEGGVADYNDATGRTKAECVAVMDKAIAQLEAE